MTGRFAAWRVRPAPDLSARATPGASCWLLAEWPEGEEAPGKFYFSNLPEGTPLKSLVRPVKGHWRVEQGYRQMKEELGLDHFEGRSGGLAPPRDAGDGGLRPPRLLADGRGRKKGAWGRHGNRPGGPPADPARALAVVGIVPVLPEGGRVIG